MNNVFHFYTHSHLIRLLGLKAKNPFELLEGIKSVPDSSIYYHTHRYLQQHHYLSPEPPNDFAYWLTNMVNLGELGESFASIDIVSFKNIEALRSAFIKILTEYISRGERVVDCSEGREFHFMACKTFIMPTQYNAHNPIEFVEILRKISINSIYFHVFEAKLRLEKDENDFVAWFNGIGELDIAKNLCRLDPYNITFESLRQNIIKVVNTYARY